MVKREFQWNNDTSDEISNWNKLWAENLNFDGRSDRKDLKIDNKLL